MKKVDPAMLAKIKGGSFLGDIGNLLKSGLDFVGDMFGKISTTVFGQEAIKSHADKITIDEKNNKVEIDNTKSNQAKADLEMQRLKEFGAPSAPIVHLM